MSDREAKVKVTADTGGLAGGMASASTVVERAMARIREAFARTRSATRTDADGMTQDARRVGSAMESMGTAVRTALAGLIGFQAARGLIQTADQAALTAARLKQVTGGFNEARAAAAGLFDLSQRLQAPVAETTAMFARMMPAVKELQGGVREATALSEILISTARLGGASAAEAAAGAQQFAQALGSGVLQGDELKSILENNQTLARELAGALGVSIGQLRKMGEEGKLTSDIVANALLGRYDQIRAQTADLPQTVGGAFTKIENAARRLWEAMESGEGVMVYLARALGQIADVIEIVVAQLSRMSGSTDQTGERSKALARAVGIAFASIVDAVMAAGKVIGAFGDGIGAIFAAIAAAMSGNFRGAADILSDSFSKAKAAGSAALDALMGKGRTLQAYMAAADSAGDASNEGRGARAPLARLRAGPVTKRPGGEESSRVGQWESQLAQAQAAIERQGMLEGQYRQRSLADNLAFWQQLLTRKDLTEKEKQAIVKKTAEVEMAMIKESFETQVKALEAESAQYRNNYAEKLRLETEIQAKYQQGTKEFESSQGRINALQRQAAQQAAQVAQVRAEAETDAMLASIAAQEQALEQARALDLVTNAQVLAEQERFEQRRNQIMREALQARLTAAMQDPDRDPVRVAQLQAAIEALEIQHQQRMGAIRGQMAVEIFQPVTNAFRSAEQAMAQSIDAILNRQQSLRQGIASIWAGVRQSITGEIARIIAAKTAAWARERLLTMAGIGADAAKAGSGAAASQASIPYVGPILAVAAMASVMAAVLGTRASIPSARGGFDIPQGMNPMTQLHEREMVLPAAQADVIRDMAAGGGSGAAREVKLEVKGASAGDFFLVHRQSLLKVLNEAMRDNAWSPAR